MKGAGQDILVMPSECLTSRMLVERSTVSITAIYVFRSWTCSSFATVRSFGVRLVKGRPSHAPDEGQKTIECCIPEWNVPAYIDLHQ